VPVAAQRQTRVVQAMGGIDFVRGDEPLGRLPPSTRKASQAEPSASRQPRNASAASSCQRSMIDAPAL